LFRTIRNPSAGIYSCLDSNAQPGGQPVAAPAKPASVTPQVVTTPATAPAAATVSGSSASVKPNASQSQEENWKPVWQPDYKSSAASIDLALQFEFNSNKILPESMKILQDLALALNSKELAGIHFRIEGHTDGQGSSSYNQKLSQLRADQVKLALQRLKVKSARLEASVRGFLSRSILKMSLRLKTAECVSFRWRIEMSPVYLSVLKQQTGLILSLIFQLCWSVHKHWLQYRLRQKL